MEMETAGPTLLPQGGLLDDAEDVLEDAFDTASEHRDGDPDHFMNVMAQIPELIGDKMYAMTMPVMSIA